MTLTEFLLARLDEDEAVAEVAAADSPTWRCAWPHGSLEIQSSDGTNITRDREGLSDSVQEFAADHIARHDPARVLAEVAAKRAIVEEFVPSRNGYSRLLAHLAAVYADHDDYRDEWKP